jgi:hypothetical protein
LRSLSGDRPPSPSSGQESSPSVSFERRADTEALARATADLTRARPKAQVNSTCSMVQLTLQESQEVAALECVLVRFLWQWIEEEEQTLVSSSGSSSPSTLKTFAHFLPLQVARASAWADALTLADAHITRLPPIPPNASQKIRLESERVKCTISNAVLYHGACHPSTSRPRVHTKHWCQHKLARPSGLMTPALT